MFSMRRVDVRKLAVACLAMIVLAVVGWMSSRFACYYLTDLAYERMVAGRPLTRGQVEKALPGFKARVVTDTSDMGGQLSNMVKPDVKYVRYTKYGGLGIDVVYDEIGDVVAVWPKYE